MEEVISFLDSNNQACTLLLNPEEHLNSWLEFALSGDMCTCSLFQEALYAVIPHSSEKWFDPADKFTYPSMITNDTFRNFVLILLSEDRIIRAGYKRGRELLSVEQAREFLFDKNKKYELSVVKIPSLHSSTKVPEQISKDTLRIKLNQYYVEYIKYLINHQESAIKQAEGDIKKHNGPGKEIIPSLIEKTTIRFNQILKDLSAHKYEPLKPVPIASSASDYQDSDFIPGSLQLMDGVRVLILRYSDVTSLLPLAKQIIKRKGLPTIVENHSTISVGKINDILKRNNLIIITDSPLDMVITGSHSDINAKVRLVNLTKNPLIGRPSNHEVMTFP